MTPVPENPGTKDKSGYSEDELRGMDRLINTHQ